GLLAALGGFITPFVLCYGLVVWILGYPALAGIFVGVAAGVTSLATKSRILVDLHLLDTRIAHVMMAGALVADTLSLVVFAAVLGVAEAGSFDAGNLVLVGVQALAYFGVAAAVGLLLLPRLGRALERLPGRTPKFTAVLLVMLVYAEGAHLAGMHGILGAFLAGLFLRESVLGRSLSQEVMHLIRDASIGFLAPVFFVTAGFAVSLSVFTEQLFLLLGLIGLATVGKVVGTALFYLPTGYGWREGVTIGLGMNGRGAVEIIVAQIALAMGLITQEVFSVLVFMAIATTALVPATLKWGVDWLRGRGELARSGHDRAGTIIVGAGPMARALARVLAAGEPVRLLDRNAGNLRLAAEEGLETVEGNALDERTLSEAGASGARRLVALTPNREVNALVASLARTAFAVPEILVLDRGDDPGATRTLREHLGAEMLFGGPVSPEAWDLRLLREQAEVVVRPAEAVEPLAPRADEHALPLAVRRGGEVLPAHGGLEVLAGDEVVLLQEAAAAEPDPFDRLVAEAPVLDLDGPLAMGDFAKAVARALRTQVGVREERLMERLLSREATHSTVILPGLAIPHVRIAGRGIFALALVRCRAGIFFPEQDEPVRTAFTIVASPDVRTRHLRTLSAIAQTVQTPDFERRWLEAPDAEALRRLVLQAPRRRHLDAAGHDVTEPLEG
ncbi:MAG: cation:proton antiporter, partial [Rhodothermales bacterium]|nr:cation:proton antiporter [Rhodothermales bacterium]